MSTTTGWHAPPELLRAYVDGALDAVLGASLERHVDACADCRAAVRPLVDGPLLDRGWDGVRARVESPPPPVLVRLAQRLGVPESTGVLLAAAASLRIAWVSAVVVALGFAVAATMGAQDVYWPFLLVAPLVPVLGVAATYGPADDRFETLAVATPYGRARLILVRAVGVVVTTVPMAAVLGLVAFGSSWVAVAWLGPALALVPVLMALASFVGPRAAGAVLTIAWTGVVLASVRLVPATWPVDATRQVVYLVLAAVAVAVLLVRSRQTRRIGAAL